MIRQTVTVAMLMTLGASGAVAQRGGMRGQMPDTTPSMGMAHGMVMGGMMGQGMMGSGMMQMMGQGMGMMATGGPGPMTTLRVRDALDLTDEQVTRLESIQRDFQSTTQTQMSAAMASHAAAAEALQGDAPDLQAYQRGLQGAANIMVQAHVAMARAAVEARGVLTPEQLDRLRAEGTQMMHSMMDGYGWRGMMRDPG